MPKPCQEAHLAHRLDVFGRWKDHVPARIAAHNLGQHLGNAFVGSVTDSDSEFAFKIRYRVRRDVIRPVENVQARAGGPRHSHSTRADQERSTLHARRSLSDTRINRPNPVTTIVEIALSAGFTPRLAIA